MIELGTPEFKVSDVSITLCDLSKGCLCCSAEPLFCCCIFAESNDLNLYF